MLAQHAGLTGAGPLSRMSVVILAFSVGMSLGCEGVDGTGSFGSLVATSNEPVGDHCPNGGMRVETGIDTNLNRVLDDREVVSTSYVCLGGDAEQTLITTQAEPPGSNCEFGGERLDYGGDSNLDGVLDPDEVEGSTYVCNGADGATGPQTLVSTSTENTGSYCPAGGQRMEVGVDDNGDLILNPSEIDTTTYLCNGASGQQSLVVISFEAAGVQCSNGGQRIDTGLDANHDGFLTGTEITSTRFVCVGVDGMSTLATVSLEPAGPTNCHAGGKRIDTGVDTNANGVLNTAEITATSYLCDVVVAAERVVNGEFENALTGWTALVNPQNNVVSPPPDTSDSWFVGLEVGGSTSPANNVVFANRAQALSLPGTLLLPAVSQASVLTQNFVVPFEVTNPEASVGMLIIDPNGAATPLQSSAITGIEAAASTNGVRIDIVALPVAPVTSFSAPSLFTLFAEDVPNFSASGLPPFRLFFYDQAASVPIDPVALNLFFQSHLGETLQLRVSYVGNGAPMFVMLDRLSIVL